ncbi:MAG: hypothetical protein NTX64_16930 [Elusimicrobia bacterium]|nr:hypothetical protein [Elusimicrobiota bacterium]
MERRRCDEVRRPARLAAGWVLLILFAARASAQQVYINSLWVSHSDECVRYNQDGKFYCPSPAGKGICPLSTFGGNISNNPHIEFDQLLQSPAKTECMQGPNGTNGRNPYFAPGSTWLNYCNSQVFLCLNIGFGNTQTGSGDIPIDKVGFELFKFTGGANALNPETTPPVRTFSVDAPGTIPANITGIVPDPGFCGNLTSDGVNYPLVNGCGYCVLWDGTINIAGELGKSNGDYGFRGTVETNQTGANGNITISQTRPYPAGATLDCSCVGDGHYTTKAQGAYTGNDSYDSNCATPNTATDGTTNVPKVPGAVLQQPIVVDLVDVHNVRSTATIVGTFSGVLAEPYSITYRLGKDATTFITIEDTGGSLTGTNPLPIVRSLVNGLPRVGEGIPDGTLQNGDAWNGRFDNGDLGPPGVYLVTIQAEARDQFGMDLSAPVTRQISLDPVQVTDILVQPLTSQATALAVLTYTLTEPATAYVDIYPPGTQFCNGLNSLNNTAQVPDNPLASSDPMVPPKNFRPTMTGNCTAPGYQFNDYPGTANNASGVLVPIRRLVEQKNLRTPVVSFWDGRDANGNIMPDGDYVFVLYGALPSQNGFGFPTTCNYGVIPPTNCTSSGNDRRIWTSTAKSGFLSIARGNVTISQITPATTVIGSSPSVAGLNPFIFSYSLSRDAIVNLRILPISGVGTPVRTLVNNQVRPANFLNREIWQDGLSDNGFVVTSGTYLAELTAADPFFPAKVATTTALFQVNLFRITDVSVTPLQSGATENVSLSYQLSQSMFVGWNIYAPGTIITGSTAPNTATSGWPPCGQVIAQQCPQVTDLAGNQTKPILTINGMRPGRLRITETWDGRDSNGLFVPDGAYVYTLVAQSTFPFQSPIFAADAIIGFLTISRGAILFPVFTVTPTVPPLFNSSATITLPPYELDYSVTRQSSMTIKILTTDSVPRTIRTLISGQVRDAVLLHKEFWDGRDDGSSFVTPGFYTVQAIANDLASQLASGSTVQQTIAVDPLRIYDVAVSPLTANEATAAISFQVSETMKVSVKIYKPGTVFDIAANPSPPESISLVKRIVGVRPARTEVTEQWDGTDLKLAHVTDGNYVFKIIASTDIAAIDSTTGNARPGATLAEDIPISEVPVVRGVSPSPEADFEKNSFVYPNPVTTPQATFNIYVPMQSNVSMKIYNLAGELVYNKDFGAQAADTYVDNGAFLWAKVNNFGRPLARGPYFVLIREDETLGARNVLQTIKKILIP